MFKKITIISLFAFTLIGCSASQSTGGSTSKKTTKADPVKVQETTPVNGGINKSPAKMIKPLPVE